MPKIYRKKHGINPGKEEDIEIKSGRFRLYFQDRYSLITSTNDFLTGILYLTASIFRLTSLPDIYGTYLYLLGAIFLTARPILKIVHNIFIYDDEKIAERTKKKDKEKDDEVYNEGYYGKEKEDNKKDTDLL